MTAGWRFQPDRCSSGLHKNASGFFVVLSLYVHAALSFTGGYNTCFQRERLLLLLDMGGVPRLECHIFFSTRLFSMGFLSCKECGRDFSVCRPTRTVFANNLCRSLCSLLPRASCATAGLVNHHHVPLNHSPHIGL